MTTKKNKSIFEIYIYLKNISLVMILVIILYLIFTISIFVNNKLMSIAPFPILISSLRAFGSAFLLIIYNYIFKKKIITTSNFTKNEYLQIFLYGFLLYCFAIIGFSFGLLYINAVKICFMFATAPFITTLILYFFYNQKLSKLKIVGLIIGFLSLIPIILSEQHKSKDLISLKYSFFIYILYFAAITSYSYGWIILKNIINKSKHSITDLNIIANLFGGTCSILIFILLQFFKKNSININFDCIALTLSLISITFISYNLYSYLLKKMSATFISFASFLEPAFGLIYSWLFLKNKISIFPAISLLTLAFGLYIFYSQELKESKKN